MGQDNAETFLRGGQRSSGFEHERGACRIRVIHDHGIETSLFDFFDRDLSCSDMLHVHSQVSENTAYEASGGLVVAEQ